MMYYLSPSYHPSWRLYAFRGLEGVRGLDVHEYLKKHCRWGGHDKTEVRDGLEYLGYEFPNALEAHEALRECFKITKQIDEGTPYGVLRPTLAVDHAFGKHVSKPDERCISCKNIPKGWQQY